MSETFQLPTGRANTRRARSQDSGFLYGFPRSGGELSRNPLETPDPAGKGRPPQVQV